MEYTQEENTLNSIYNYTSTCSIEIPTWNAAIQNCLGKDEHHEHLQQHMGGSPYSALGLPATDAAFSSKMLGVSMKDMMDVVNSISKCHHIFAI